MGTPRRGWRTGDFKSHGVAVCTPQHQQRQQQQQLQQVEEEADMGVIANEGKHVCTFRDKPHGRQPRAPYREGRLVGQSRAA